MFLRHVSLLSPSFLLSPCVGVWHNVSDAVHFERRGEKELDELYDGVS